MDIRGVNLLISDFETEAIETLMWNPLHFAVYYQHFELVKYFIQNCKVNVCLTAPKALAESEKDPTNSVNFPEDKILLLLIACNRRNAKILTYLLDKLFYFWPNTVIDNLLCLRFNEAVLDFSK